MRQRRSYIAGSGGNGAAETPADRYRREVQAIIPDAVLDADALNAEDNRPAYCIRLGIAGPMLCSYRRTQTEAWRATKRRFSRRTPESEKRK